MHRIIVLISLAAVAFAESADGPRQPAETVGGGTASGAAHPAQQQDPYFFIIMMIGMVAFIYFVILRPQRKEEKRRKELLSALKRGDKVVTIGGVHGTIETVGEQTVDVRIGSGDTTVVVTFNKGAVNSNTTDEAAAPAAAASGKK